MYDYILQYLPLFEINKLYGVLRMDEYPLTLSNLYKKISYIDIDSMEKCEYLPFWINSLNYSQHTTIKNENIIINLVKEKNKLNNSGYNNLYDNIMRVKNKDVIIEYIDDKRFNNFLPKKMAILYYKIEDEHKFIEYSKNIQLFDDIRHIEHINNNLIISYHKNLIVDNKYNDINIISNLISYNNDEINNYIINKMDINVVMLNKSIIPSIIFRKNEGLYNYYKEYILNMNDKTLLPVVQSALYHEFIPLIKDIKERNKLYQIRYIKKNINKSMSKNLKLIFK